MSLILWMIFLVAAAVGIWLVFADGARDVVRSRTKWLAKITAALQSALVFFVAEGQGFVETLQGGDWRAIVGPDNAPIVLLILAIFATTFGALKLRDKTTGPVR